MRTLDLLDRIEREGKLSAPEIDVSVIDFALPLWKSIFPRQAARIAVESAEAPDKRLENFPHSQLKEIHAVRERWVKRSLHRNEHLDEIAATLKS